MDLDELEGALALDMRTHHLFISHSWTYSNEYQKLVALLNNRPYFRFKDYSVPRDDPIHNAPTSKALREAIRRQMAPSGVVLILAGVYATYSKWIDEEIALAKKGFAEPKPIVAIRPRGSLKTSATVKDAADHVVSWNKNSIVAAIRDVS